MNNNSEDFLWVSQVVLFNNKKAFDKLVKKYQSPMRRFFLNLTVGNKETSDDLSQETFIKMYLRLNSFKGTARFSTWMYRIAYNVFYDYVKSNKTAVDLDEETNVNETMSYETSKSISRNIDIYESLKILREEERTAIVLFYMEDLTHPKIANIMECPIGTVKSYILRGKEKLYQQLKNAGYGSKDV